MGALGCRRTSTTPLPSLWPSFKTQSLRRTSSLKGSSGISTETISKTKTRKPFKASNPSVCCGTISTANTFTVEIVPQWTDGEFQQVFRIFGTGRVKTIVGFFLIRLSIFFLIQNDRCVILLQVCNL